MKKVRCINNNNKVICKNTMRVKNNLTRDKIYSVIDEDMKHYLIIGEVCPIWLLKERFIEIENNHYDCWI